ncbi:MAG: transcription-repair coupling factor [Planctomycetaceae bacterium]|nr:transcription-repair coupling factor [Planctomycetaceae bacterium]MBQ2821182.1 transcription-repair coupling factor [Thermoguttaceae bacterium]
MNTVLPEIVRQLRENLAQKGIFSLLSAAESLHIEGVWGAGSAAVLAAILQEMPSKKIIVLAPSQKTAIKFYDDLPLFTNRQALFFPWLNDASDFLTNDTGKEEFSNDNSQKENQNNERLATFIPDSSFGERLRVLKALLKNPSEEQPFPLIVTPIQSLLMPCPNPNELQNDSLRLHVGDQLSMDSVTEWLVTHGFQNTTAVEFPGEFFARGGLIDIFAIDGEYPVRIEFFGDEIDSIREFNLSSQRSLRSLDKVDITAFTSLLNYSVSLMNYLSEEDTFFFMLEPEDIQLQGRRFYQAQENPERLFTTEEIFQRIMRFHSLSVSALGTGIFNDSLRLPMESVEHFSGDFSKVKEELDRFGISQTVYLLCPNEAERKRLETIFEDTQLARRNALKYRLGMISDGFRLVSSRSMVISSSTLFHREEIRRGAIDHKKSGSSAVNPQTKAIDAFTDLQEGDFVVHVSFGIARYRGLKLLEPLKSKSSSASKSLSRTEQTSPSRSPAIKSAAKIPNAAGAEEHMILEFRDSVFVYVPVSKIALVQKYVCGGNSEPKLSTYGGKAWERMKKAVTDSVQDLASEMLDIQAIRLSRPGISFPVNTPLQQEFDALFPFTETPDQLKAMEAIHADMVSPRPMDRLLCGDVGFGKTEIAMRTAFTAVEAGYQVGIMVPTTVLAEQHLRTFKHRMATFPVTIECISRFSSPMKQKEILKRLAEGKIDILIGTHRLASSDIKFQNLGLIIIDEEQKFGVEMKESLKKLRATVDVLTMTATPIPRTLHMSLLGIRDISSLETPPTDRRAIETRVTRFQNAQVRNAIMREIDRNGQIFFVHNRVQDIEDVAARLKNLVPEARIAIGHAQMPERELEQVMLKFINHEIDLLLSTTIVESGLDIPNANTIFIDEANRYGLAELHQLRGRVGRFKNHAYCYLLVKEKASLTENAVRRLKAIEEFAHLGSGFSIAMRDLEIRGAGNILGTLQSGQIAMVGYELYCDILDESVRKLRKLPPRETIDVDVDLPLTAYLPHHFIPDMRVKMELYRRLSRLTRLEHVDDFEAELIDRFGKLPHQVQLLLKLYRIRILAHQWLIYAIHRDGEFIVLEFYSAKALQPVANRQIGHPQKSLRFVDEHTAYLPLDEETMNSSPDSGKILNYLEMLLRNS